MNLYKLTIFFLFAFSSLGQTSKVNTLTIRSSYKDSKTYKIKSITKTTLAPEGGSIIKIETSGNEMCIISLDKIVNVPRPNYNGCTSCMQDDKEAESHFTQLFINSSNPNITCDVTDGKTTGFQFIGATNINGKSTYTSTSLMLDSAVYSDGAFTEPEVEDTALDRILDNTADLLFKMVF